VLSRGDNEFTVSFAGWHEPFDSPEVARRRFTFGLSERCKLRILSRGTFDYRWTVRRAEATVGRTILRRDCWFFRRQRGFFWGSSDSRDSDKQKLGSVAPADVDFEASCIRAAATI
jgi:hypothetical protein